MAINNTLGQYREGTSQEIMFKRENKCRYIFNGSSSSTGNYSSAYYKNRVCSQRRELICSGFYKAGEIEKLAKQEELKEEVSNELDTSFHQEQHLECSSRCQSEGKH